MHAFIITKASVREEKTFPTTLLGSVTGACKVYYPDVVMVLKVYVYVHSVLLLVDWKVNFNVISTLYEHRNMKQGSSFCQVLLYSN